MRMVVAAMVVVLSMFGTLTAKGTPAGTLITNQAQIDYVVGNTAGQVASNEDRFVIDRVADVLLSWQDNAPVEVSAGDNGRILTFRLSNLGNSDDNISLAYEHNASSDFLPQNVQVFIDSDGNGEFDPATDTLVVGGVVLAADANVTLFVVGDIPDDNTTDPNDLSYEILKAETNATATAGPDDPAHIDTVVRTQKDQESGIWVVRDYWLATRKTATIHSDDNATHTGTRITYTVECYIDGNATGHTIDGVTVRDTIPAGTRYVGGSLRLAGAALTDAADSDAGEYDANATQVEVRMGTLIGTTHTKMQFDVRVK
jgi:uncharacterized repeat protein (TIGR01451 family)